MAAGQSNGSGANTDFDDEKVRKDDILSNRDKAQRQPGQSLDGKGVQVDEYKDIPTNQRPPAPDDVEADGSDTDAAEKTDRPGFDLGGASGDISAGKGLGLGTDAKEGRDDWKLPRDK
jgi:hypothetical protein